MGRPQLLPAAVAAVVVLLVAGCGADDGAGVRELPGSTGSTGSAESGSAAGAGSAAGSGSATVSGPGAGSGSGLSASELQAGSDDPQVQAAVADYRDYVTDQVDMMVSRTSTFTDAVRAGDLAAAQAAYAPSRVPWERVEPIAGLVEDVDVAVDARVDDVAGPDDPDFTGWHRLERLLFEQRTTEGGTLFADQLDADLAALQAGLADLEIPAAAVPVGASELVEEVSLGKITGEEERYSKTDLWDVGANLEGSQAALEHLRPALEQVDPDLAAEIDASFAELWQTLEPLREGDGWVLYCRQDDPYPSERCPGVTVPPQTVDQLTAQLAALSEQTSMVAGALRLT